METSGQESQGEVCSVQSLTQSANRHRSNIVYVFAFSLIDTQMNAVDLSLKCVITKRYRVDIIDGAVGQGALTSVVACKQHVCTRHGCSSPSVLRLPYTGVTRTYYHTGPTLPLTLSSLLWRPLTHSPTLTRL